MKTHTETLVQFVLVILSVLVHDGLKTRNILNGHPFSVTVTFRVSFGLVSAFIGTCRVFLHGSYLLPHGTDQLLVLWPVVASFLLELLF